MNENSCQQIGKFSTQLFVTVPPTQTKVIIHKSRDEISLVVPTSKVAHNVFFSMYCQLAQNQTNLNFCSIKNAHRTTYVL